MTTWLFFFFRKLGTAPSVTVSAYTGLDASLLGELPHYHFHTNLLHYTLLPDATHLTAED